MSEIEIWLAEEHVWCCTCQDTLSTRSECARIRPALAELGCDDASVKCTNVDAARGTFTIARVLTASSESFKLKAISNIKRWTLKIFCKIVGTTNYYEFYKTVYWMPGNEYKQPEDDRSAIAKAFGGLVGVSINAVTAANWTPAFVSEVLRAAESFGLTHRDVMSRRSGNFLHKWAAHSYLDHGVGSVLRSTRAAVEPRAYRQLLSERDERGETPYEIAARRLGASSEVARLFQLTGPKSASGVE